MDVLFRRLAENRFLATEKVGGAWDPREQHIAPSLGLLAHLVEQDRDARRSDGLQIARVSFDILGPFLVGEVEAAVRVLRPGRTIELVEATLAFEGRVVLTLRAWLMQRTGTEQLAGSALPAIPSRHEMEPALMDDGWPGEFVRCFEMRRQRLGVGRAQAWMRPKYPLVDSEPVSPMARMIAQLDLANGITPRVDATELLFPNLDLDGSFFRAPQGEWLGFDTSVSFGPSGVGQTQSTLHDELGPLGTVSQTLTLRYR
ncbi:thioesterase family protein [Leucobacter coleopterorum]|uniref:Thioesterase family protein n=1 Tax=Leucobacter coleopterorum TaxID=2714933 RepID=A0ABX6JVH0_9MICO|nr:thioesterase family protein [Leucobacter coleopterorum]QIM17558.1 thioesterase family protein [Leucobacter coleopterorum]